MRIDWHLSEFVELRKSPEVKAELDALGSKVVDALNVELAAAQAARLQPITPGYVHHVTPGGNRARLQIVAKTARAQAHEAKHQSILKRLGHTP